MARAFSEIAFTETVRRLQSQNGSRDSYALLDAPDFERDDRLTETEARFIGARDGFYQATVSETGWPYVQFRGGPAGFLKVIDDKTLAFADFRGNQQFVSTGNLTTNPRIALFLMDYPNRMRLKILATAAVFEASGHPDIAALLIDPDYRALPERLFILTVAAFDWNCPQHIPRRCTPREFAPELDALHARIRDLEEENRELKTFLTRPSD